MARRGGSFRGKETENKGEEGGREGRGREGRREGRREGEGSETRTCIHVLTVYINFVNCFSVILSVCHSAILQHLRD